MDGKAFLNTGFLGFIALAFTACAPTKVSVVEETATRMPMPHRVLVYNFAVSPDEVALDRGISARIENYVHKTPRTQEEFAVGHSVANALALHLTEELQAVGIPAIRSSGKLPAWVSKLNFSW